MVLLGGGELFEHGLRIEKFIGDQECRHQQKPVVADIAEFGEKGVDLLAHLLCQRE